MAMDAIERSKRRAEATSRVEVRKKAGQPVYTRRSDRKNWGFQENNIMEGAVFSSPTARTRLTNQIRGKQLGAYGRSNYWTVRGASPRRAPGFSFSSDPLVEGANIVGGESRLRSRIRKTSGPVSIKHKMSPQIVSNKNAARLFNMRGMKIAGGIAVGAAVALGAGAALFGNAMKKPNRNPYPVIGGGLGI